MPPLSPDRLEEILVETISNLFRNKQSTLGIAKTDVPENSAGMQFQWENIEDSFALKTIDSTFHESLTSAFHDIHSYKYLHDPTFQIAFEKRMSAIGIPQSERQKAIKHIDAIKEEYSSGKEFDETEAGWHPNLDKIIDTTINATSRTPSKEPPYFGGGPAPAKNELK